MILQDEDGLGFEVKAELITMLHYGLGVLKVWRETKHLNPFLVKTGCREAQ